MVVRCAPAAPACYPLGYFHPISHCSKLYRLHRHVELYGLLHISVRGDGFVISLCALRCGYIGRFSWCVGLVSGTLMREKRHPID